MYTCLICNLTEVRESVCTRKDKKENGKDVGKRMETHCKFSVNFLEIRSLIGGENCLANGKKDL